MSDPFVLVRPVDHAFPVLISSPHSGQLYPAEARWRLGVSAQTLAALNDGPVHELFEPAVRTGAMLIHAQWSRAWIDLNRDPNELDADEIDGIPAAQPWRRSMRVQAGLGVVPIQLGGQRVHCRRPSFPEIALRIATIHDRYHQTVAAELDRLIATFGQAVLLDCHSMPGAAHGRDAVPDIVLGDRFGRSCSPAFADEAERACRAHGLTVARNQPFAGGWISERHGQPVNGAHALQIEVRRDLFFPRTPRNATSRRLLQQLAIALTERLGELATRVPTATARAAE